MKPWGLTTEDYSLALAPSQENIASFEVKAQELSLADKGEYFVICPMGSYARKNLPLPLALQLIRKLEAEKPVYLIGGPGEKTVLEVMAKAGRLPAGRVLAGTLNLPELAVFLQRARAMISVDTGPMHMAQAVQCPTVAVFGPRIQLFGGLATATARLYIEARNVLLAGARVSAATTGAWS